VVVVAVDDGILLERLQLDAVNDDPVVELVRLNTEFLCKSGKRKRQSRRRGKQTNMIEDEDELS
jgi:hypothetical protein